MNVFIVIRTFFDSKSRCNGTEILACFRHKKFADEFCSVANQLYGLNADIYSVVCKNVIDYDWKK